MFPSSKETVVEYCYSHLADLTTSKVRECIIQDLEQLYQNRNQYCEDQAALIDGLKENPPSETTVWRWMKRLGFVYDVNRKTFYVDDHEKGEQRLDRLEFSEYYLTKLEPHMCRWYQTSKECLLDMVAAEWQAMITKMNMVILDGDSCGY